MQEGNLRTYTLVSRYFPISATLSSTTKKTIGKTKIVLYLILGRFIAISVDKLNNWGYQLIGSVFYWTPSLHSSSY